MKEKSIVDMVMRGAPWEDVLESIVYEEGLDPWDIDIEKLADSFLVRLDSWKDFNFRIPARLIIISAILLNLKSTFLIEQEEEKARDVEQGNLNIDLSQIPDLDAPSVRIPKRRITLEELVDALGRAFATEERRTERKVRAKRRFEEAVHINEFDIEKEIEGLYSRISTVLTRMIKGTMTFSELVPNWERDKIVNTFLPLLHLNNEGKVTCEQKEMFKEIYIKLKEGELD